MVEQTNPDYWQRKAAALSIEGRAFIGAGYDEARSDQRFACHSAVDGRLLADVAACDGRDADRAVAIARTAFTDGRWSRRAPAQRKAVLQALAGLLLQHQEELALLESLDMGKPIRDSLAIDIVGAARCLSWYGEAIDKRGGEVAPTSEEALALVTREPVGVVACIVPWNFPLLMACWKIAPALAAGNSVILKPSEKSPLSALRIAALALEAGLPEGVLQVLPGFGASVGAALAHHPDVDCLAFTGSTTTGKAIMQASAASNLKRVWLELGGKSANIVFADAQDLEAAAKAAAFAIFFNQGEMCSAGSRLLVESSIKEAFLARLLAYAPKFAPGDPLDPRTRMGAIVDSQQGERVMAYIRSGQEQGARLRLGGERVRQDSGGFYIAPTVFEAQPEHRIAREEIFGPVLSVLSFDSPEQAIALANDSEYGLAAAVWTADLNKAHLSARRLRAGTVYVNCYDEGDLSVPFGGYKQSGNGRDKSLHALDKYTELKTTWLALT